MTNFLSDDTIEPSTEGKMPRYKIEIDASPEFRDQVKVQAVLKGLTMREYVILKLAEGNPRMEKLAKAELGSSFDKLMHTLLRRD